MRKILALVAALALVAVPVSAQNESDQPPPGAAVIIVYQYDGVDWLEAGFLAVPPIACSA